MTYDVSFQLDAFSLSVTDNNGDRVVLPGLHGWMYAGCLMVTVAVLLIAGTYTVWVGGHQPVNVNNASLADSTGLLEATFTVTGSEGVLVSSCPSLLRKCYACL